MQKKDARITQESHSIELKDLLRLLKSDEEKGLTHEEVEERIKKYGKNLIKKQQHFSVFKILVRQLSNPLILILIAAAILSFLFFSKTDFIIIIFALLVNFAVGVWQEKKANDIFQTLSSRLKLNARVVRDDRKALVPSEELVPGDIILLEAGMKVPADARIISEENLEIDESILTGESKAVAKENTTLAKDTPLYERKNIVFAGTVVLSGATKALVFATGKETEFGKIAAYSQAQNKEESRSQKRIKKISIILGVLLLSLALLVGVLAFYKGFPLKESLLLVISLAVASVPEGLPAAIAVAIAVGMERILRFGGLVKNASTAENIGDLDIVLSDKTGTLTTGKMSFVHSLDLGAIMHSSLKSNKEAEKEILKSACLASDAFFDEKGEATGRPIEKAILHAAKNISLIQERLFERGYERLNFLTFSSKRRYAASLNADPKHGRLVYFTGAPEALMAISNKVYLDGKSKDFGNKERELFKDAQKNLSLQGYRITAVARAFAVSIPKTPEEIKNTDVEFLGLLIFEDEIREDVKQAIKDVKKMEIETFMVTGDNPQTALAIARRLNIAKSEAQVIEGVKFESLDDAEILSLIEQKDIKVFARMLPEHKLRLAKILKKEKNIIAMTGDGVNDAPALAFADVGIAVESGTDIAKSVADLILLKNSFSVIEKAIKEGRRVIANTHKIIIFMISTSFGELALLSFSVISSSPLPLLPKQLLWHNMVEGGLMNFPFAFEKGFKSQYAKKSYRSLDKKANQFIIYYGLLSSLLILVLYLFLLSIFDDITHIRSILFISLSVSGFILAFALKDLYKPVWKTNLFDNKFLNIAIIVNLSLLFIVFYFDSARELLSITTINLSDLITIVLYILANIFVTELVKGLIFSQK